MNLIDGDMPDFDMADHATMSLNHEFEVICANQVDIEIDHWVCEGIIDMFNVYVSENVLHGCASLSVPDELLQLITGLDTSAMDKSEVNDNQLAFHDIIKELFRKPLFFEKISSIQQICSKIHDSKSPSQ